MKRAHTPPSTTAPPAQSGGEPSIDWVAGDPPVPITVWRTPAGDDQATIPARLAQRVIAAYSRPGEAVIDLTPDHALTDATLGGGRRHYPGWFTDASALIIATTTPSADTGQAEPEPGVHAGTQTGRGRRGTEVEPAELAAWFGDDLTEDLPPYEGVPVRPSADSVRHATALVVACWPLHAVDATNRARLSWLLHACGQLLRPGGCLVLVVAAPTGATAAPADYRPIIDTAREARLGYLQHIVAVRADVDGDQFVYYATDAELLTLAQNRQEWAVAHLTVHADLLVFTPLQATSGTGGGNRG
jgi:hypothetical protein